MVDFKSINSIPFFGALSAGMSDKSKLGISKRGDLTIEPRGIELIPMGQNKRSEMLVRVALLTEDKIGDGTYLHQHDGMTLLGRKIDVKAMKKVLKADKARMMKQASEHGQISDKAVIEVTLDHAIEALRKPKQPVQKPDFIPENHLELLGVLSSDKAKSLEFQGKKGGKKLYTAGAGIPVLFRTRSERELEHVNTAKYLRKLIAGSKEFLKEADGHTLLGHRVDVEKMLENMIYHKRVMERDIENPGRLKEFTQEIDQAITNLEDILFVLSPESELEAQITFVSLEDSDSLKEEFDLEKIKYLSKVLRLGSHIAFQLEQPQLKNILENIYKIKDGLESNSEEQRLLIGAIDEFNQKHVVYLENNPRTPSDDVSRAAQQEEVTDEEFFQVWGFDDLGSEHETASDGEGSVSDASSASASAQDETAYQIRARTLISHFGDAKFDSETLEEIDKSYDAIRNFCALLRNYSNLIVDLKDANIGNIFDNLNALKDALVRQPQENQIERLINKLQEKLAENLEGQPALELEGEGSRALSPSESSIETSSDGEGLVAKINGAVNRFLGAFQLPFIY